MTDSAADEKPRAWFTVLATATLVCFGGFCTIITICAFRIPQMRAYDASLQRYLDEGWTVRGVTFSGVSFSPDDAEIVFQKGTRLERGPELRSHLETARASTGRRGEGAVARDLSTTMAAIHRLLSLAGVRRDSLALSHDYRELAFVQGAVLLHRSAAGRWRCAAGDGLPDWAARLNESRAGSVAERLASPSILEWADAAVEAVLAEGARPSVPAERILRTYRSQAVDELVEYLVWLDDDLEEVARVAASANDDPGFQQRLLDAAAQRMPRYAARPDGVTVPSPPPAVKRRLIGALARRDWGDAPSDALRSWVFSAIEDGQIELFEKGLRDLVIAKLRRTLDRSYAGRLAKVVEQKAGLDAAVAYLLLRHLAGEPLDAAPEGKHVAEGRAWVADRRARTPDFFK